MFDFSVKGTVAGFNTAKDGRCFVKIQPSVSPTGLNRDERPGIMELQVSEKAGNNLAMHAAVQVEGKAYAFYRDSRDSEGKPKSYLNYRFEAESIEPVKA